MKKIIIGLILLLIILFGGSYFYLQSTVPQYDGTLKLSGLHDTVTVKYDRYGIPHIYARNEEDAYFALGYVHAQERLFQMEMIRRVATGTLAEVFGPELLPTDKLFRTLGIAQKSQELTRHYEQMQHPYKKDAEAYLAGVNTFVASGPTPVEFSLTGMPKRPFTITDAFNTVGYMSFGFADGFRVDPILSKVAATLGKSYLQAMHVHSVYDSARLRSYFQPQAIEQLTALQDILDQIPAPLLDGSNSWIVGRQRSATGYPLFENDTHIGFSQPSVWFEAHLEYPGTSLYGHYLAGFPFAILGHNRLAAWGMTMFENDDVDLYQEKANPDNSNQIWRKDHWLDLQVREETIAVKDGEPVKIKVRTSDHGPIINQVLLDSATTTQPVSVYWEYLHAGHDILAAIYALNYCRSMDDARAAAAAIHAPGLNIMYADTAGNIAWWAAARLAIRPPHVNSKLLLDGASGDDDYLGYYDFSHNPQAENPPWGYVYSANNQPDTVKGVLYPGYYRPLDRAGRIARLLETRQQWTVADMQQMTADVTSDVAVLVAGEIADVLAQSNDGEITALADLLAKWDGNHNPDQAEPTVYYTLLSWILYESMADELGYKGYRQLANSPVMKRSYLYFISLQDNPWWDNTTTANHESRQDIFAAAARRALTTLQQTTGSANAEGWQWRKVHTLTHGHPLGKVEALKPYFDVGPLVTPGGNEVINNMMFKLDTTGYFPVFAGPAVRTVIDLGQMSQAMSINPTGQSGHFLSPHYSDQAQMFVDVQFRPQLMNKDAIEADKSGELLLMPK
ncbi:MAG TPA: penicillin acylase family protein [Flammeovirgaceae bacterium]|nr:penicillin acylase family protein [Flammeovirgaceae bacterium]